MFSRAVRCLSSAANWPVSEITPADLRRLVDDIVAGDAGVAGVRARQRREHPHGRGLAGAVRPEQRHDRSGLDPQVEIRDCHEFAKPLGQAFGFDRWCLCHGEKSTVTEKILQLKFLSLSFLRDRARITTFRTTRKRDLPFEEAAFGEARFHQLLVAELGEQLAESFRRARRAQEAMEARRHPDEGLRERKRRMMRQRISDVATIMFATRGFDKVKVSAIAEVVGVSEKTIFNYFPTKESMVLDWADEAVESVARMLRERPPNESLTETVSARDEAGHGDVRRRPR